MFLSGCDEPEMFSILLVQLLCPLLVRPCLGVTVLIASPRPSKRSPSHPPAMWRMIHLQVRVLNELVQFPDLETFRKCFGKSTDIKAIWNIELIMKKDQEPCVLVDFVPFAFSTFLAFVCVHRNQSARRCGSLFLGCFARGHPSRGAAESTGY